METKKSQYKGVTWYAPYNKWVVHVNHKRKRYYVGYFEDEFEGALAYDEMAIKIKGEQAKINFGIEKKCEVCGDKALYFYKNTMYLCKKHISQMNQHNKILDRTIRDLNEIVTNEDYAEIVLYDRTSHEIARAKIDIEDIDKVKNYKWYLRPDGYVATNNKEHEYTYLHYIILGYRTEDCVIDHEDRNKLNNYKTNLRIADNSQNGFNKGIRTDNTSGKVGVHWVEDKGEWCAMIGFNNQRINLGYFKDYNEAVKIRVEAEEKYFKEFKAINEREFVGE